MLRNIVLALSSLALLIVLFVAYSALVNEPRANGPAETATDRLAPPATPTTAPLRVGESVEVPAGGKIVFKRYDERTGRPRDMFICEDWQPVPDARNEIHVSAPELAMLLPNGMIVTVLAEEGQIAVDRMEQSQMRPKTGWLTGNVRIIVDRATASERRPRQERPQDLITVAVDHLRFDLEIGELETDRRFTVSCDDFEIAGTGLHLIWNQAANRIETLTIAQGEQFVLYATAGLFGMSAPEAPADTTTTAPATGSPRARSPRRRTDARSSGYVCTLGGGVSAEHFRGMERVGTLSAEQVELLFDVGTGAERLLRPEAPATATTSRPADEARQRLVLHWNGPLSLKPVPGAKDGGVARRRFTAHGAPVILTRADASVHCGRVAFHDDTQRIWLYPTADAGTVSFDLGAVLTASAQSVYVDQNGGVVKLIGEVVLRSQRGAAGRVSTISCTDWAELHLARGTTTSPAGDALLQAQRLESATFVGDVHVDLGAPRLTAHRLEVGFRHDAEGQTLEELLDTARAFGAVRLTSGNSQLSCAELTLGFATTATSDIYPRDMQAVGAVTIRRGSASIRGRRTVAELAPPPTDAERATFVLRTLEVSGDAELLDPDNRVAARGREIAAVFTDLNRLASARVSGSAGRPALLRAWPYTVRGGQIDLDRVALTLHVDGPSELSFQARRSLQGRQRGRAMPIVISSRQMLHVDGRRNTVHFVGQVEARSENEHLYADNLTLLMEDIDEPRRDRAPATPAGLLYELGRQMPAITGLPGAADGRDLWRQVRGLWRKQRQSPAADDELSWALRSDSERIRKEPLRLTADNAVATSATHLPGQALPVMEASIRAPLLEVDIAARQIVTTGQTQLLLLDRRGVEDLGAAQAALGIPSALLSRGPSQTAMQCLGRMTYTLGPDGPDRRDTAVFEDSVFFVHRSGKEMVNIDRMLPELAANPEALDSLHSRNASLDCDRLECWFAVEADPDRAGAAWTGAPLRLASLTAVGSVYLRDQEGPRIREVHAAWLEFSREQGLIAVRGAPAGEARMYFEDAATGHFDVHAGRELTINLRDGTVRSDAVAGEMRR